MSSTPVSVMVFTLNEEIHLPACLAGLAWCDDIIVIDSFSTDSTEKICRAAGARFFQNRFEGFGEQRNWALRNTSPRHEWVLILDADERVPEALAEEVRERVQSAAPNVAAYRLKRRFHMWGRWLRHSSLYPTWVVRLIRAGRVRYINRGHAETQEVDGEIGELRNDLIDENLKGIEEWFERQNRYSTKDAQSELDADGAGFGGFFQGDPLVRRSTLKGIASGLPCRSLLYFIYSYFWRGGFRDGKDGLMFCLMKALYQGMVDVKKYDLQKKRALK